MKGGVTHVGLLTLSTSPALIWFWMALLLPYGVLARKLPLGLTGLLELEVLSEWGLLAYWSTVRGASSTPVWILGFALVPKHIVLEGLVMKNDG